MNYFDDIRFVSADVIPACNVIMDNTFPRTFSLEFFLSGSMTFGIDHAEQVLLSAPAAHWHHPSHSYQYGPGSKEGYYHHFVSFQGPRGQRILEEGLLKLAPCGYLFVHQPKPFARRFRELVNRVRTPMPDRHARAVLILEELLVMLLEGSRKYGVSDFHQGAIDEAADSIRSRPYARHNIDVLARSAHLSVSHFRRLFRQYIGSPPHDYLLTCKMQKAAAELGRTDKPTQQVAAEAGYDDPAQFSKVFKDKIGLPPIQYRRTMVRT